MNKESNDRARRLAEEAISLEPNSARAYSLLPYAYFGDHWLGPPQSEEDSTARGIELAKKAIALGESDPLAHGFLALLYVNRKEYDKVVEDGEQVLEALRKADLK